MKYGLIGEKLSHSFSKEIHEMLADYTYELCELTREELYPFFTKRDFCAINVTIPYKKEVIPFLDEISEEAMALEAVNVIINKNGRLCGYNTDYLGLKEQILHASYDMRGKKVLVLGTGGASRTAALVARDLGAKAVLLVSREKKSNTLTYREARQYHSDADVIINGTPVGMYPDIYSSPIDIDDFSNLSAVFDVVYNPLRTTLTLEAQKRGVLSECGLYMLVSQAVHAVELFTGSKLDTKKAEEIYDHVYNSKQNVVLIGMPSCGKTTVGSILAQELKREMVDIDDEIVKELDCSIADYFRDHPEKEFRDVETKITKEISKRNGIIISTGGGCILRQENVDALRANGRLYFIDRSLKNLVPTDSRPLASSRSNIEALYQARYEVYKKTSDIRVDGDLSPKEEANLIIEEFYKLK